MIRWMGVVGGISVLGACASRDGQAPEPPPALDATTPVTMFERDHGWIAADGASTVDLGDGRVLWLFGDTLVGALKPDGGVAEGTVMINNTLGIGGRSVGELEFHWGRARGSETAAAWVESPAARGEKDKGHWLWPAGGGVRIDGGIGARVVLFYTMLRRRHTGGGNDVWNFQSHGTTAVTILNPADPVEEWRTEVSPLNNRAESMDAGERVRVITWGPAAMIDPEDPARVLVFGVDVSEVLDKRLVLARAPKDTLDEFGTWEFRTSDGWSGAEEEAAAVGARMVDEFSVHRQRIGGRERYVLVQNEPNLGARILVRFADRPEGPWSDGVSVYTCPEPASDRRLMVYSAKAHAEIDSGGADELLVTYCVNSTDFEHMLSDARLYRPRLVRIPLSVLENAAPR